MVLRLKQLNPQPQESSESLKLTERRRGYGVSCWEEQGFCIKVKQERGKKDASVIKVKKFSESMGGNTDETSGRKSMRPQATYT